MKEAEHIDFSDNIAFESKSEAIKKYAYTWAMMPLTRAIDTLVITLKNPDSETINIKNIYAVLMYFFKI